MDTEGVVAMLRESEAALKARGVSRAGVFGARALGDSRPGSRHRERKRSDPEFGGAETAVLDRHVAALLAMTGCHGRR